MSYKLEDKMIKWSMLQKCARLKDVEIENEMREDSQEQKSDGEIEEVIINFNKMKPHQVEPKKVKTKLELMGDRTFYSRKTSPEQQGYTREHQIRRDCSQRTSHGNCYNFGDRTMDRVWGVGYQQKPLVMGKFQGTVLCKICNRLGHEATTCRTRLQACFLCGAQNHFVRDCPQHFKNRQFSNNFNRQITDEGKKLVIKE